MLEIFYDFELYTPFLYSFPILYISKMDLPGPIRSLFFEIQGNILSPNPHHPIFARSVTKRACSRNIL